MAWTEAQITDLLKRSGDYFEVREPATDGSGRMNVYRGAEATRFIAQTGQRNLPSTEKHRHIHKVYDRSGNLIYERDYLGRVIVGSDWQKKLSEMSRSLGKKAIRGRGGESPALKIIRDAIHRNKRMWLG